jgi:hypothetical protein
MFALGALNDEVSAQFIDVVACFHIDGHPL